MKPLKKQSQMCEKISTNQWMLSEDLLHTLVDKRRNRWTDYKIFSHTPIPHKGSIWRKAPEYLENLVPAGQYLIFPLTHVHTISDNDPPMLHLKNRGELY